MPSGFIYEWVDAKTNLRYIGRHEGSLTDGYIGSGPLFVLEYSERPQDFSRQILWISDSVTSSELKAKEEEFLLSIPDDEFYFGKNRKYYNQIRNSNGYTSEDNPMKNPETVARMMETRRVKGCKNVYENTIAKHGIETDKKQRSERMQGNTFGSGNKGKPKSEEHKAKIAKNRRGGLPPVNLEKTLEIYNLHGLKNGAIIENVSYNAFKARVSLAKKKLTNN